MRKLMLIVSVLVLSLASTQEVAAWPRTFRGRSVNVNVQRNVSINRSRGFNSGFNSFNRGFSSFNSFNSFGGFVQQPIFLEQPIFVRQVPVFVQPQVICSQSFFAY